VASVVGVWLEDRDAPPPHRLRILIAFGWLNWLC
jgi:hypothetical protein